MPEKTVRLPSEEEMLRRLLETNDSDRLQENFYPGLLHAANQEMTAQEVAEWFKRAMDEYTEGMPSSVVTVLRMMVPKLILALVPDAEVAAEITVLLKKT